MPTIDSNWGVESLLLPGYIVDSFWGRKNVTLREDAWEVIVFYEGSWVQAEPVRWNGTEWE